MPSTPNIAGRLFLPFADNDPKTADVVSKVLLLAHDREIKDPNIADQIRAAVGGSLSGDATARTRTRR